jgi:hypothetical protein
MSAEDRSDIGMYSSVRIADRCPVVRVGILEKWYIAKSRFHALEVWKRDLPCSHQGIRQRHNFQLRVIGRHIGLYKPIGIREILTTSPI